MKGVTYAFFDMVLNKFGAPIEVFTNQGTKFHGEFKKLCEKTFIDHCTTSWDHFEIYELAKWMVQMVEHGLWKYGIHKGHTQDGITITMASYGV